MGFSIAVAGKGGTGKTSLCGLTIRYLIEKKHRAVLAVDADANSNLNDVLGVKVHATVGKLRETSLEAIKSTAPRPGGMSMEQLFDYQIQQALIEANGFDLLVMGRPEGAGCYCAANNIIRKYMDKLADNYPYTVMDNEAGLEHLSRRTTQDTDLLLIISDSSVRGIMTAGRIGELVKELKLNVKRPVLIVNRVQDGTSEDKSLLSAIKIDRRRGSDREQLGLFPVLPANEPGDARVTIAAPVRANIAAGFTTSITPAHYLTLASPVTRRLYRLLAVARAQGQAVWTLPLSVLAEQLPLVQRYPSHLQRVLQPANEMLVAAGLALSADFRQDGSVWTASYVLPPLVG